MQPDELEAALSGAHAACDVAWHKVEAAATALLPGYPPDEHARRWREFAAATAEHDRAVARLAALTAQLLAAMEVTR